MGSSICSAKESSVVTRPTEERTSNSASPPSSDLSQALSSLTPLVSEVAVKAKMFLVSCVPAEQDGGLEFGARSPTNEFYRCQVLNSQLLAHKLSWVAFVAALSQAFGRRTVNMEAVASGYKMRIPFNGGYQPFSILLTTIPKGFMHRLFIEPLMHYYSAHTARDSQRNNEVMVTRLRCQIAADQRAQDGIDLTHMRQRCTTTVANANLAKVKCEQLRTQLRRFADPQAVVDYLYAPGRYPLHIPHCAGHAPKTFPANKPATELIKAKYVNVVFATKNTQPTPVYSSITDPVIKQLLDSAPDDMHQQIMKTLQKIDDWDFDVFALQQQASGGSLFMVMYCLLHKYGLVSHFNIDPMVLSNWCAMVEAGYHNNPYHNSTHAADVTQVLHYLLYPGGLHKVIKITPEDAMASIMSAGIHDFDHPGLNNNFHVRTGAYLAVLYNDRSVLENHHAASVFELMKDPKFDIFHALTYDQRKECRDTVVEMVLSTDMGNHGKIFNTFKKRLGDGIDWSKREDIRLALSIAIKMADISNVARPPELYTQWAARIGSEFYDQGDLERKLQLSVSPFMDRQQHDIEFAKGQVSFMNYIVVPLFELGAQLVPDFTWLLAKIQSNKEHYQQRPT
eukprot:NODE_92_length_2502_cov_22.113331_g73_i0.p1 GENE.NODE_92_length_2502_cov_22.113331_g73_i0~~NODE_92_length_2502_cov_22.113331_g73_i0.p1  ORF type:complete len:622 (+),score=141.35 NODE_92_length_2502_cov_22.113331_g73_i0:104-1969(+)